MGSRTNKPSVKTLGKERRWICLSPLRDAVPNGAGYGCNKDYMDCTAKLALNAISHTSTEQTQRLDRRAPLHIISPESLCCFVKRRLIEESSLLVSRLSGSAMAEVGFQPLRCPVSSSSSCSPPLQRLMTDPAGKLIRR